MRKPALLTVIGFSAGIIIGNFSSLPLTYISFFLLAGCIFYLFSGIVKVPCLSNIFCWFIIIFTGWLYYEVRTTIFPANHIINYTNYENSMLIAKIIRDPDLRRDKTFLECIAETLIIIESDTQVVPVVGKLRISAGEFCGEYEYGDRILVYSPIVFPKPPADPGSFDYRSWLNKQNIYGIINVRTCEDIVIIERTLGNPIISKISLPIKRVISRTIDTYLMGSHAAFLKAITIGERRALSREMEAHFQNTGVIHILVVSGLHVTIIAFIIFQFLGMLRVPWLGRKIITCIFLLLYIGVADFRYPIVRATIMTTIGMLAFTVERDIDISNIISSSALIILFLNPQSLFDVSFQLSFMAICSIVYFYPRLQECRWLPFYMNIHPGFSANRSNSVIRLWNYLFKYFGSLFIVSVSAWLGIMPLIAYYFYRIPVISIIANLIVVPLTGLCVVLSFIMVVFNLMQLQFFANLFAVVNWLATTAILKSVEAFSKLSYGYFWVSRPSYLWICFFYLVLINAVNLRDSVFSRRVFVYSLLIGLNIFTWTNFINLFEQSQETTHLSVGSTFIKSQGKNILINGGRWSQNFDAGESVVAPFLRVKGVRNIDIVIATGPEVIKIGGLFYIIENFKVNEFMAPATSYPSWHWIKLLELVDSKGISSAFYEDSILSVKLVEQFSKSAIRH